MAFRSKASDTRTCIGPELRAKDEILQDNNDTAYRRRRNGTPKVRHELSIHVPQHSVEQRQEAEFDRKNGPPAEREVRYERSPGL